MKQADLPPGLQPCPTVLDRLKLYTADDEATARKQGAVEFSEVDYSTDPGFCSTGKNTIGRRIELVQALLVRFTDAQSADKAYRAHVFGVGMFKQIDLQETVSGSASGFGPNSEVSHTPQSWPPYLPPLPDILDLFIVSWQKGSYLFKGGDVNLSTDENLHAMTNVYSRIPA